GRARLPAARPWVARARLPPAARGHAPPAPARDHALLDAPPHTDRRERASIRQMTRPYGEGAAVVLVRWTLGALFIDEFFVNLHHRNYTEAGYVRLINHYISSAHSPAVWHSAERFVIDHAQALAIAQAVGEL